MLQITREAGQIFLIALYKQANMCFDPLGACVPTCHIRPGRALGMNMRSNMWENGPCPGGRGRGDCIRLVQLWLSLRCKWVQWLAHPGRGTVLLSAHKGCPWVRWEDLAASRSETVQVALPGGTPWNTQQHNNSRDNFFYDEESSASLYSALPCWLEVSWTYPMLCSKRLWEAPGKTK